MTSAFSFVAKADLGYTRRNSPARFFRRLGQIKTHGVFGSEDCASGTKLARTVSNNFDCSRLRIYLQVQEHTLAPCKKIPGAEAPSG